MRFKGLDLNLVVALDTMLEVGSVSRAAERLNLTQPAVSAALARLRTYFQDELLVPVGRRMIATPLAEELRPLARQLMEQAGRFAGVSNVFDPLTSRRRFRLATSDYILTVLISRLVSRFKVSAPDIQIDIFPTGPGVEDLLDRGEIDFVIGPRSFLTSTHPSDTLFFEPHVLVGWSGNPAMAQPIDLETFLTVGHVAVRIGQARYLSFAERHLEVYRDRRKIEITTTQFSSVPFMLVGTERVGVLQRQLAEAFVDLLPLTIQPLPFEMPLLDEVIQYHATRRDDAGTRWLIAAIRQLAAQAGAGPAA